ncbi:DNA repair protein XRCC2 [Habropoda laboriosa]|uniref:DNA repair protein XRCC2 n=1 Tax=Habropoda laboriosa TaxID=597456 RepID=A0A0L7R4Y8_9HYME|nr:PREDICTED: DNA repair protein XRCC2 [Habropoda laboriosa]KOC65884.1 DNA repair protein XRCC2 [Habropoda laboriosa]
MRSQIESGAELLARLSSKPSLFGLENTLFPEGPQNSDVIEIGGEQSTGKTLLLSQMLAKCILPDYYGTIQIEGCNASAIFINTDHHFQISKLVELMSDVIDVTGIVSFASNDKATEINSNKTAIIQNSLRNLRILDCYDNEQFSLTLRMLDDMFLDNAKIALLAIDSITAYYWQDREDNISTIDNYIRKLLKLIRTHTTRFNVVTIYTKLYENMHDKGKKSTNQFLNNIDYKIQLCRMHDSQHLACKLETIQTIRKIYYSISLNGIKWEIEEGKG